MTVMAGLRVLEAASRVAGPYCGKLLADYGAEVIKVEAPDGDPARHAGPFPGDIPDIEASGLFLHLNSGKRSVSLRTGDAGDAALLRRLAAWSDLVIDDGMLAAAGIEYEDLAADNAALVVVNINGFGETGPYSEFRMNDFAAYAATGWMASMGRPGQPPVYPGRDYPFYVAGIYAAFGAAIALMHARRSGCGQRVSVSVLNAAISIGFYETTTYSFGEPLRQRHGSRASGVAASLQPCRDGWIAIAVNLNAAWRTFCDVIGAPELALGDFADESLRLQNAEALQERVRARLANMTVADVVRASQARRIAVSPVATTRDLLTSEQLRARGWWTEVDHPVAGRLEYPGRPFRLSASHWRIAGPAPALGQDNGIIADLDFAEEEQ
jgi:crotonobetainyl-CoA:carnitine CoA-transferase CaiB-like acyl-CoA transferase